MRFNAVETISCSVATLAQTEPTRTQHARYS